jgi:hypothetical protein
MSGALRCLARGVAWISRGALALANGIARLAEAGQRRRWWA